MCMQVRAEIVGGTVMNTMTIRRAEEKDIDRLIELLHQVLELHAEIRPDVFRSGTTKYTKEELRPMLSDEQKPIYVAVDENNEVIAYAFCQLREPPFSNTMVPFKSFFVDDFCVDAKARGGHVGKRVFEFIKQEAVRLGCYEVTLNVWSGNDDAERFYEKMGMKTKERQMELIL